jgi:hypothetical protein
MIEIQAPYKYQKGYIHITNELPALPENITVEGKELLLKTSFHTTLLCAKDVQRVLDNNWDAELTTEVAERVIKVFNDFVSKKPLEFRGFTGEFRFVERGDKKSIVAMCEVSNVDELFTHVNSELGIVMPVQPTHVTLYTLQPNKGIGISDQGQLSETRILNDEEIKAVRSVLI